MGSSSCGFDAHSDANVRAVTFRDRRGVNQTLECDAVAVGFGLRPETQLAALSECDFRYDPTFRQWFPATDGDGRARDGLYLAGDGAAIGGADAAELSGRLAALATLSDLRPMFPE